jgi:alkanesulfonate monooxygenase SsuD/methylene tetrahydromethanopterin reductase-like flavin-dependent oxidoreductase (luciferase family)
MRIGVLLMPTDPWADTVERAQHLEALGYDHIWVYDHLSWQRFRDLPWHATTPWITGLAAATERIRFGTMVSNLNVRHPVLLAKDAMTIDHVSNGRLTIGLGAAGVGFDATVLGQTPLTPSQRMDRLEEFVPLFDGLLRGDIRNHQGDHYIVDEARLLPGCVQRPRLPIAIAAGGPRGLRLTARAGNAWITLGATDGVPRSADEHEQIIRNQIAALDDECKTIGRDPADLDRIYLSGHVDERPLASLDAFDDFIGRYGDLGFTDVVFHHPIPGDAFWDDPIGMVDAIAARHLH